MIFLLQFKILVKVFEPWHRGGNLTKLIFVIIKFQSAQVPEKSI